ncbi:MAG: manganese efflux pump MntP family protein [Eubacteriales bacterium]
MGMIELFILAVGVSMDAFAVSISRGVKLRKVKIKHSLEAGLYFGGFQALMPVLGYLIGGQFYDIIKNFDHWIAFLLLGFLGAKMLKEAFEKDEEEKESQSMLLLAIATSIDALAVGVSLVLLNINIIIAALFIGITTFGFSAVGVKIGADFGDKYKSKAEILGGIILVGLGVKIFVEHMFL